MKTEFYYEVKIRHSETDVRGKEKEVTHGYLVKDCLLFAEAESRALESFNGKCDVSAVRRSAVNLFINEKADNEEVFIYIATLAEITVKDDGLENRSRSKVGVWASSVADANTIVKKYLGGLLADAECEEIKKSSFVDML